MFIGAEFLLHRDSGRMGVECDDGRVVEVTGEQLDDVMARGWIEVNDDVKVITFTDKGVYWLTRWWDKSRPKKARQPRFHAAMRG
jgi:allophanate hydrolase subunit 2